jgi:hypothetical protein
MKTLPIKKYTFTLAAGTVLDFPIVGRYFKIVAATGLVSVTIDSVGTIADLLPGQGLRLRDEDESFDRLQFIERSGASNTITVLIADANFVDDRVSGEVATVDGGKARTLAGAAYTWRPTYTSPGAIVPNVQLYNFAGNNKNLIVTRMVLSTSVAGLLTFGFSDYLMPTNGAGTEINNKKKGGPASGGAFHRLDSTLAVLGGFTNRIADIHMPAGVPVVIDLDEPLVVTPGNMLGIGFSVVASTIAGLVEFFEETPA